MFNFSTSTSDPERLSRILGEEPKNMTDEEFVVKLIEDFRQSDECKAMITAERYYRGEHDILDQKREVIGKDGELEEVKNLPNNRIVDNQYAKAVDQKKNYLFSKPITFISEDREYTDELGVMFADHFQRQIKTIGHDAINCGIGYLYVNYDDKGELIFKRIKPHRLIPLWSDFEKQELNAAIHFYEFSTFDEQVVEKVEVFNSDGVHHFYLEGGTLVPAEVPHEPYFVISDKENEEGYNWDKIPIIPFKASDKPQALISKVKSLQDGINTIVSAFMNNMQEDARNTIMVLVEYDGQDLGEFRRNLSEYGAVKVRQDGGVETLNVEVNATNYESMIKILKNALLENVKSFDAKDDRLSGNTPNQMNIKSMYSDIDLDADDMESEFKASFEKMLEFVKSYLLTTTGRDFSDQTAKVTFKRNILINETEMIENIRNSAGLLSTETLLEQHPWVENVQEELERIESERPEAPDMDAVYDELDRNADDLNNEQPFDNLRAGGDHEA